MSTHKPLPVSNDIAKLLDFIAQAAIDNIPSERFLREFQKQAAALAPALIGVIDDPGARRAVIGDIARTYWNDTPQPQQGWRPHPLPKPERNGPCPCGSGRKYKQCCQSYQPLADLMPRLNMLKIILDLWPEADLFKIPLLRLDPVALADAASQWVTEGKGYRSVVLLEHLFDHDTKLDDRHVACFDALCEAYLEEGLREEREPLVERIAAHPNRMLASAAMQKATVIAADDGDYARAWERFGQAMRLTPDDPFLGHLEVLVLKSEGRIGEAGARASAWAARLRGLDRPEYEGLIASLEGLAEDPDAEFPDPADNDEIEDEAWSELLAAAPPPVELLYRIGQVPVADEVHGRGQTRLALQPLPALARVEREWRDRFSVQKPHHVDLYGDALEACAEFSAILEFMSDHPEAWQSFEILDDLALIARDWFEGSGEFELDAALGEAEEDEEFDEDAEFDEARMFDEAAVLRELTGRAVELLEMCVDAVDGGSVILEWSMPENRPPLRLVAQRIEVMLDPFTGDDEIEVFEVDRLQAWMLELNPHDDHGYRNVVMRNHLLSGDTQRAIELAERYEEDVGDMPFNFALALYRAGRKDEARQAWLRGAAATPAIADTLLAKDPALPDWGAVDEDFDEDDPVPGGPEHAWRYRMTMLEAWRRGGALAWAGMLPRVVLR